jgi:uncharacterized protein (TIGR02231 family)
MKNKPLYLLAGLLFASKLMSAQSAEQRVDSHVDQVTVFLSGAQVNRTAKVNVAAGTSTIVFQNLAAWLDEHSLQVHATGDFTILSVKKEINYLNQQAKQKNVELLQQQKDALASKQAVVKDELSIVGQEETMLLKNQVITGQNSNLDVLKLKQALDFQNERLTLNHKKQIALRANVDTLAQKIKRIEQQIDESNRNSVNYTGDVFVTVVAKQAINAAPFALSYVVNNASWTPSYDIRATDVNSPVNINYRASIAQNSGEDWKKVHLVLSTGNPSVNGQKPELNPWYLNPVNTLANDEMLKNVGVVQALQGKLPGVELKEASIGQYFNKSANFVGVVKTESQTNIQFEITEPYTIPSDGKEYTAKIGNYNLEASYQYAVAPKLNTDVFLTAQLLNWNQYNFLPGQANLYFDGTYIGQSLLNTQATNDTLNLSLGTDKNIVVTRTLQKSETAKQVIGSNKKETKDWLITVKNRKRQAINLLVEDQVPVSQNKDIEVDVQETSGAKYNHDTGLLQWTLKVNPTEEKKVDLRYQVKYPKNQIVIVQ